MVVMAEVFEDLIVLVNTLASIFKYNNIYNQEIK